MTLEKQVQTHTSKRHWTKMLLLVSALFAFVVLTLFSLSSCSHLPKEAQRSSILNSFLPNLWVFIADVIALVIVLLLLGFLVWKPTKRSLDERSKVIHDEIDSAKNTNQLAQRLRAEAEKLKLDAYQSAETIIYDAQSSAYNQKREIVDSAKNYANEIVANAQREIVRKEQDLREQVKNETAGLVFKVAEQLLARNISTSDNKKMVDDLIKEIDG